MCVCAPRMSLFFSGRASCTRSGWRKPAVARHPIVRGERNHSAKTDPHCRCVTEPRRADAHRSCECAFVHRECRYFSGDRRRAPGAAGVSQPWHAIRSCVVNVITPRKLIPIAGALPNHGGLTPAAPVNVRMCTANVVFFGESGLLAVCQSPRVARWAMLMAKAAAPVPPVEPATTQCRHDGLC
jgi:hypothetical protein